MKKILLAEGDALLNKTLTYNLIHEGCDTTSALNVSTAAEALAGAADYITKPFSVEVLLRKIRAMFAMLEHRGLILSPVCAIFWMREICGKPDWLLSRAVCRRIKMK